MTWQVKNTVMLLLLLLFCVFLFVSYVLFCFCFCFCFCFVCFLLCFFVYFGPSDKQGGSGTTSLAWKYIKLCGYSDRFCKNLNQRSLTPRWPLTPHLLRSYVWPYLRIIVSKSHENTSKYVDTVRDLFAKTWTKGHWPLDDFWPYICWSLMCDSTQGWLCPSHIQWPFLQKKKTLKQRSLTPRWSLTPHLLRSHVWLYPKIIVSKSHENISKYVDTVTLSARTWTKGHWPLDDLWPHNCWGHMCDSTQGSLCPSPMGIHQCMWIQWSILQITNQRSLTLRWPWPHICWGLMCDSTQG